MVGFIILLIVGILEARKHPNDPKTEENEAKRLRDAAIRRNRWYDNHPF